MKDDNKSKLYCLAIILFLVLGIVIPIWWKNMNLGKSIEFNTLYTSDCILGVNTPADVQISIYLDSVLVETINTGEFGIGTVYLLGEGLYTYSYNWQGVAYSDIEIDDSLLTQVIDIEVDTWTLMNSAQFFWAHDMSIMSVVSIDLLFNGDYVTTITTDISGWMSDHLVGLVAGSGWQFVGASENITILTTDAPTIIDTVFYITPKGILTSNIILKNQIGIIS